MSPQNRDQTQSLHRPSPASPPNKQKLSPSLHFFDKRNKGDIKASPTLRDAALHNTLDWLEFIRLCNKNYIFFLWVTKQYYLLLLLFKYPPIMKQRMHCKKKMQAYKAKIRKIRLKNKAKTIKRDTLSPPVHQKTHQPHLNRTDLEPYLPGVQESPSFELFRKKNSKGFDTKIQASNIALQQDMKSVLKRGRRSHSMLIEYVPKDILEHQESNNLYRS